MSDDEGVSPRKRTKRATDKKKRIIESDEEDDDQQSSSTSRRGRVVKKDKSPELKRKGGKKSSKEKSAPAVEIHVDPTFQEEDEEEEGDPSDGGNKGAKEGTAIKEIAVMEDMNRLLEAMLNYFKNHPVSVSNNNSNALCLSMSTSKIAFHSILCFVNLLKDENASVRSTALEVLTALLTQPSLDPVRTRQMKEAVNELKKLEMELDKDAAATRQCKIRSSKQMEDDDTKENIYMQSPHTQSQHQKSLTSDDAVSTFDRTTKKPSLNGSFASSPSTSTLVSRFDKYNPKFDKPIKSSSAIYPTYKDWEFKQQRNIGNSCYMNSTMQILAACPIFVSNLHSAVLSLAKRSNTITQFDKMMTWLSGEGKGRERGPVMESLLQEMRTILKGLDAIFEEQGGTAQQDAEECLTALLGAVSDECTGKGFRKRDSGARRSLGLLYSQVKTTPIKGMLSSQSDSPLENEEARGEKRKKKMPASCDPVDLMEVKMRDVKSCASCGDTNEKEAMEHRVHLGVGKEEKDKDTPWTAKCVQQLLTAEVAQEEIISDFKCDKCAITSKAIGTKQFVQFGEYVIIVLKRFGYDENARLRKLNTPIRVPLYLDMANFIQGKTNNNGERQRMDETIDLEDTEKKEETTPSRKRGRERANTVKDEDREEQCLFTTSNRSSTGHSEPSRNEKRSRIERRRARNLAPPNRKNDDVSGDEDDVTIVEDIKIEDSDDDKVEEMEKSARRSLETSKTTPAWKKDIVTEKEKTNTPGDSFDFPSDDEDVKMETSNTGKISPFSKSSMEQTGGGGGDKDEEEDDDDDNSFVDETVDDEEVEETEDGVKNGKTEETEVNQEEDEEKEEETKVPTEEEKKAKMEANRIKMRKRRDEKRQQWRALFVDTDPPPPHDHIMFRPVDDRWMRSQCQLLGVDYKHDDSTPPHLGELRAQSNLCKIATAPDYNDMISIDGDGNCLFRAISWWVTGSEKDHAVMRKRIVNFMFEFPKEFGERTTGSVQQPYTRENTDRMLEDGEWGTQCEIYGAATLLGVDIYTYHESRWKAYRPLFEWTEADGYTKTRKIDPRERTRYGIYLENDMNLHYDVVHYMEPVAPESDTCYRLLGSILHHGKTACSGHYVADVYDQAKNQWLHCDDDKITERKIIDVLENAMNNGYVLVYGRNGSKTTGESEC